MAQTLSKRKPHVTVGANILWGLVREAEDHAQSSRTNIKRDEVLICFMMFNCLQYPWGRFRNWRKLKDFLNIKANWLTIFNFCTPPSTPKLLSHRKIPSCHCHVLATSYSPTGHLPSIWLLPGDFFKAPQLFIRLPFPPLDLGECKI